MEKETKSRDQIMQLIRTQGLAYMRTLTIHEKKLKKTGKPVYFIRPTINGTTYYVEFSNRKDVDIFLALMPDRTNDKNKKYVYDYFHMGLKKIPKESTKGNYIIHFGRLAPITKMHPSAVTLDDIIACYKGSKKGTYGTIYNILSLVARASKDSNFTTLLEDIPAHLRLIPKRRSVRDPEGIVRSFINYQCPKDLLELSKNSLERARYAFLFMCATGVRIGEFMTIIPEDFDENRLKIHRTVSCAVTLSGEKKAYKYFIQDSTKGGEPRVIILSQDALFFWSKFTEYRSLLWEKDKRKENICYSGLAQRIKEFGKIAGVKENVSPHIARHIFGTIFGRQCKNLNEGFKLQKMLGHKNFSTTQHYITSSDVTEEDLDDKFGVFRENKKTS